MPHETLRLNRPPEAIRRRAADRLDRTDEELTVAIAGRLPDHLVDLARGSIEEGRRLLQPDPDDVNDHLRAVGSWVLAETAWSVLRRRGDGLWRCCFVNPLHGEATDGAELGGGLEVPVCKRCRTTLAAQGQLEPLLARVGSRWRRDTIAYYEVDSVWARTGFGALVDELWRELGRDQGSRTGVRSR